MNIYTKAKKLMERLDNKITDWTAKEQEAYDKAGDFLAKTTWMEFYELPSCCAVTEVAFIDNFEEQGDMLKYMGITTKKTGAAIWTGKVKAQEKTMNALLKAGWKELMRFKSNHNGHYELVMLGWTPK